MLKKPTQLPVQTDSGTHPSAHSIGTKGLFLRVKQAERGANQSLASSTEVKNRWSYIFIPQYAFMACTDTILPLPHAVYCSDYRPIPKNNKAISY